MKKLLFAVLVAVSPCAALAEELPLRHFRGPADSWNPLPRFLRAPQASSLHAFHADSLSPESPSLLKLKNELVQVGRQKLGPAVIDETWTQTVLTDKGHVLYAAGAVIDELPRDLWLKRLRKLELKKGLMQKKAEEQSALYRAGRHRQSPELRLRRAGEGFEAYWRIEFVSPQEDLPQFLELAEDGTLLRQGEAAAPGADGRALAFPLGPKFSRLTEVTLYDLSGDGTLSGRRLQVESALGLEVKMPDLRFFFSESDRRLDLAQVYYSIQQSARWLKDKLGAELRGPLSVRLHVGDNGVSNAAFYHQNRIYLGTGDGVMYKDITRDPSIIIHESVHALIDSYAGLPSEGEGGSLNEGFADLFTALILRNPRMGESSYLQGAYRRTLENKLKAYIDFQPGVYQNGSIIAGTFWDMRRALGDEKLAELAFKTLVRLGRGGRFADFVPALSHAGASTLSPAELAKVMEIARARGWRVDTAISSP